MEETEKMALFMLYINCNRLRAWAFLFKFRLVYWLKQHRRIIALIMRLFFRQLNFFGRD